jgi:threonyl-tRNA synthetase
MIIVGEKEQAEGLVSIRKKGQGDLGSMSIDAFISVAQEEIQQLTYETFNK